MNPWEIVVAVVCVGLVVWGVWLWFATPRVLGRDFRPDEDGRG